MTEQLYKWLEKEWRFSNHVKYQKYFPEWVNNLTPGQIQGFQKAMESAINETLIQH